MERSRTRGQRAGLSREVVLAAAGSLVRDHGPDALTMRAVGDRLGVRPNALYSYVASKDALVDAVLDDALAQVGAAHDADDPLAAVAAVFRRTYAVLLAHRELVPLYLRRQGVNGPQAMLLGRSVIAQLERAGVRGDDADEALLVLIVHTIGCAAFATTADDDHSGHSFERGLDWLIAGIREGAAAG